MQKILAAFFVTLFLISGLTGYSFASGINKAYESTQFMAQPDQVNLVLVEIDDTEANPQLVSLWTLFSTRSMNPSIIIKKLLPGNLNDQQSLSLSLAFSQVSGKISSKFVEKMAFFNFNISDVIVIGPNEIQYLSAALLGEASIRREGKTNENLSRSQLEKLCARISSPANNVTTSFSFVEKVFHGWLVLVKMIKPYHCEVIQD